MRARLATAALAAFLALDAPDARACSCVGPRDVLVGPDRVEDAPVNTRIRVEVAEAARAGSVLVRVSGEEAAVDTTRTMSRSGR